MILIILLAIYALSAFGMWNYFRLAYGKNGRWKYQSAESHDVFMTLLPLLNSFINLMWLVNHPTGKQFINLDKFFNIKK